MISKALIAVVSLIGLGTLGIAQATSDIDKKRERREVQKLEEEVKRLDMEAVHAEDSARVFQTLSKELGVPVETLKAQQRGTNFGFGRLFIANAFAKATGKTFDQMARELKSEKGWGVVARENNAKLGKIISQMRHSTAEMRRAHEEEMGRQPERQTSIRPICVGEEKFGDRLLRAHDACDFVVALDHDVFVVGVSARTVPQPSSTSRKPEPARILPLRGASGAARPHHGLDAVGFIHRKGRLDCRGAYGCLRPLVSTPQLAHLDVGKSEGIEMGAHQVSLLLDLLVWDQPCVHFHGGLSGQDRGHTGARVARPDSVDIQR